MNKDEPKNKKLHYPLNFVLPPSISEFGRMVNSLRDSIFFRNTLFPSCFSWNGL